MDQHLLIREIARLTDVSQPVVLEAINLFGIPQNGYEPKQPEKIPFSYDYIAFRLAKKKGAQELIRIIPQLRVIDLSLWKIAG